MKSLSFTVFVNSHQIEVLRRSLKQLLNFKSRTSHSINIQIMSQLSYILKVKAHIISNSYCTDCFQIIKSMFMSSVLAKVEDLFCFATYCSWERFFCSKYVVHMQFDLGTTFRFLLIEKFYCCSIRIRLKMKTANEWLHHWCASESVISRCTWRVFITIISDDQ